MTLEQLQKIKEAIHGLSGIEWHYLKQDIDAEFDRIKNKSVLSIQERTLQQLLPNFFNFDYFQK